MSFIALCIFKYCLRVKFYQNNVLENNDLIIFTVINQAINMILFLISSQVANEYLHAVSSDRGYRKISYTMKRLGHTRSASGGGDIRYFGHRRYVSNFCSNIWIILIERRFHKQLKLSKP